MVCQNTTPLTPRRQPETRRKESDWIVSACPETGLPVPVRVCEAGATELRLQTDRPFVFGSTLRLSVSASFHSRTALTDAVVHHCQPANSGWWVGVFLRQCLPESLLAGSSAEGRNEIWYEANWRVWMHPAGTSELVSAVMESYSLSGMVLLVPQEMRVKTTLALFATPNPDSAPVTSATIRTCRVADNNCWRVVGRIPDHNGRAIPVALHHRSGVATVGIQGHGFSWKQDVRSDWRQYGVPDAEFAAGL